MLFDQSLSEDFQFGVVLEVAEVVKVLDSAAQAIRLAVARLEGGFVAVDLGAADGNVDPVDRVEVAGVVEGAAGLGRRARTDQDQTDARGESLEPESGFR